MKGTITVVNTYTYKPEVGDVVLYIGRGSALGNPWVIKPGTRWTREAVIQKYKDNLPEMLTNERTTKALNHIEQCVRNGKQVKLMCFCKPLACHGDWIKELVERNLK